MKFDGLVFMTYIFGSIFIILGTLMRFSVQAVEHKKIVRLINTVKVADIREETPDAFGMLIQFTGVLWFLSGTAYGIIFRRFVIKGIMDDFLTLLVLCSPLMFFMVAMILLRKCYWQSQK